MREDSSIPAFAHSCIGEEWRTIPEYDPYAVSSRGRVRGLRGHILRPWLAGGARQYLYVQLGTRRTAGVHVLVCEAFHGPRPAALHEVAHTDGDAANNAAANLRWVLHAENVSDQRRHGTLCTPVYQGERHPRAKLTEKVVASLRGRVFGYGEAKALAEQYGVSTSTIRRAAHGQSWVGS
jgi:hypothetical protein